MTGRLVASLLWLPVVLIAPLWRLFLSVSVILWPSGKLDPALLATPIRLLFVAAVFAGGYLLTSWIADWVVRTLRARFGNSNALLRPHGGDSLAFLAFFATCVWLFLAWLLDVLTFPLMGAAVLVFVGIKGGREPLVIPPPAPIPVPPPPAPLPEPSAEEDFSEDSDDSKVFRRVFTWLFNEEPFRKSGRVHTFQVRLTIPKEVYEKFRERSHEVTTADDFVTFASAELDDEVVTAAASQLRALVNSHGFDRLTEIHLAMAFTLSIRYALDEPRFGGEYPRFPVETLVDKEGDCEDHAILCGAVLYRLGHRVGLILMDTGPSSGHAALVVEAPEVIEGGASFYVEEIGCEMFYCEVTPSSETTETTTAVQWWLGMPPPKEAQNFKIFPIGPATSRAISDTPRRES